MYTLNKIHICYGHNTTKNTLCPDTTIYCFSQKNGKLTVKIFDAISPKPFMVKKFNSVEEMDSFIDNFVETNNYMRVIKWFPQ